MVSHLNSTRKGVYIMQHKYWCIHVLLRKTNCFLIWNQRNIYSVIGTGGYYGGYDEEDDQDYDDDASDTEEESEEENDT